MQCNSEWSYFYNHWQYNFNHTMLENIIKSQEKLIPRSFPIGEVVIYTCNLYIAITTLIISTPCEMTTTCAGILKTLLSPQHELLLISYQQMFYNKIMTCSYIYSNIRNFYIPATQYEVHSYSYPAN